MLRAAMAASVAARPSGASLESEEEPARVLVADDDAATRDLIATTLRASGYEAYSMTGGLRRWAHG